MAGRRAVGLDIGTTSVRAAQISWRRDTPTLERFGQVALPVGAVRDGEVVDVDAVAAAVRELWAGVKFATKRVTVGVANQKVIVRQVDLPWLPLPELRASLPFQVADVVPIPVEQAILDLHPLEEVAGEDGSRRQRILLVAAARDMVTPLIAAVEKAGLQPDQVDLTSFAVLRALGAVDELGVTSTAEALVDIGHSVTNIVVHQGGVPRFVRILLMGGAEVTETVADRLGVPVEQAEAIKRMPAGPTGGSQLGLVVDAATSAWVDEVRGSLDYYLAQPGSARLSKIVLSGGGAQLAGLAERLSAATRLPVEPGLAFRSLTTGRTGLTPEQLSHVAPLAAVPVGLAMGRAA